MAFEQPAFIQHRQENNFNNWSCMKQDRYCHFLKDYFIKSYIHQQDMYKPAGNEYFWVHSECKYQLVAKLAPTRNNLLENLSEIQIYSIHSLLPVKSHNWRVIEIKECTLIRWRTLLADGLSKEICIILHSYVTPRCENICTLLAQSLKYH